MNIFRTLVNAAVNPNSPGVRPRIAAVVIWLAIPSCLTVACGAAPPSKPRFLGTCGRRPTTPLTIAAVTKTLNDHGFKARIMEVGCSSPTVATIGNAHAPHRDEEGDVTCGVSVHPTLNRARNPRRVFERAEVTFTGTEFAIANVDCVLFGNQAASRRRLRAALTALRRGA